MNCAKPYCKRSTWRGRRLCFKHVMQSRKHMATQRAKVRAVRAPAKLSRGPIVGSPTQRAVERALRDTLLPRWP